MRGIRPSHGVLAILLAGTAGAQTTVRVSLDSNGNQGNDRSGAALITPDGRFVAFQSDATNLVPGDTNGVTDIFVRDRETGTTERVSVGTGGVQASQRSYLGSITPDGRFVVFSTASTNLVPGDTNGFADVFVRDRATGTTERVSISSGGAQGDADSGNGRCSADGRFVSFGSDATTLVPGDTNDLGDVFVRDRATGTTERVSTASDGSQGQSTLLYSGFWDNAISADGRFVVFLSDAPNLVPNDTNFLPDFFVKDRRTGYTERVSLSSNGTEQQYDYLEGFGGCWISADGRWVAFGSQADNLAPGDTNGWFDGFLRDRLNNTTELVTLGSDGAESADGAILHGISDDGRYVLFAAAWDFQLDQPIQHSEVYFRDRFLGTTERVSVNSAGIVGDTDSWATSISSDGRYMTFDSLSTDLVPGDTNGFMDAFVRDRLGAPEFTSSCDPGASGVSVCPCGNPPSRPGRGCDNSRGTGGAVLSASGGTFLSSDSLTFQASNVPPTALCVLMEGDALAAAGVTYGQGVRCVGGSLERLFVRSAVAGSVTVPDFAAGDSQVSARSAAMGDAIQPGERRWYLVYYRDPIVLGGCPAASTFNTTQTGEVTWSF